MTLFRNSRWVAADPREAALGLARVKVALGLRARAELPTLGRYEVREQLGAGANGRVYRGWDPKLERDVALKVIPFDHAPTSTERESVRAEATALASLSHPNIVPVFDLFVWDGEDEAEYVMVMEVVEGRTLDAWLAEDRPSRAAVIDAHLQAAAGLAAAHERGIVHRDFKPRNAMRRTDGRVLVLDFGLATQSHADPVQWAGTPAYMAPEQHAGKRVTPATDVYSLAVSLFEALYGVRPFQGRVETVHIRKQAGPPSLPPGGASRDRVFPVLCRALEPDPARRTSTMREFAADVRAATRPRWRLPVLGGGTAAVGLALALGTAEEPSCRRGAEEMAQQWRARHAALARALDDVATPASLRDETLARLDADVDAWRQAMDRVCAADKTRPELTDEARLCLVTARRDFEKRVDRAIGSEAAARALARGDAPPTSVAACSDAELGRRVATPDDPELRERIAALSAWWRDWDPEHIDSAAQLADRVREAERIGHAPTTARVLFEAADRSRLAGRPTPAHEYFVRAYFEAVEGGADRIALESSISASARDMTLDEAREWARIGFALCDRLDGVDGARAAVHLNLAAALMESGRLEEAAEHAGPAVELARAQSGVRRRVLALNVAGTLAERRGERARAIALFEEALAQSEVLEGDRAMLQANLAVAYSREGRDADAEQLLRTAIASTGSTPSERWAFMGNLARFVAKDPSRGEEAMAVVAELEAELAAAGRLRTEFHADALTARANVAYRLGEFDDAEAALRAADRILEIDLDLDPAHVRRDTVRTALAAVQTARSEGEAPP